jgi:hypothetical protein
MKDFAAPEEVVEESSLFSTDASSSLDALLLLGIKS